jgi:hypothetical protein
MTDQPLKFELDTVYFHFRDALTLLKKPMVAGLPEDVGPGDFALATVKFHTNLY